jgi:CHAD domain-containing protein
MKFNSEMDNIEFSDAHLDRVFKPAGRLRELNVSIGKLEKMKNVPKPVIMDLKKDLANQTTHFIKNTQRYKKNLEGFEKDHSLQSARPSKKNLKKYFKEEVKKARKDLHKKKDEKLHRSRKRVKRLLYIYNALDDAQQKKLRFKPNSIDKIQEKIGKWHDVHGLVNFIAERSISKQLGTQLKELKKQEKKQFNKCMSLSI